MYKHPVYVPAWWLESQISKNPRKNHWICFSFPSCQENYLCPRTLQNNATSGFLKRNMDISTGGKPATEHLADSRHFKLHEATKCQQEIQCQKNLNLNAVLLKHPSTENTSTNHLELLLLPLLHKFIFLKSLLLFIRLTASKIVLQFY